MNREIFEDKLGSLKRRLIRIARKLVKLPGDGLDPFNAFEYNMWLKNHEAETRYKKLKYEPLISVVIPVYNVKGKFLKKCIESVLRQVYKNFEIILVDDASNNTETLKVLEEYENNSKIKIKHRKINGHISRATNDGIAMAKGEFIALMDDDDELSDDALYEIVKVLNQDKKIDFIYSDEDKITERGRRFDPHFKSDWAPDTFLSSNYISHLGVIRKSLIEKSGGFRKGYEGAQDYDLYLRVSELTDRIYHIPKILYHWRAVKGSTAKKVDNKNYALERGRQAIKDALRRRKIDGEVKIADGVPYYYIDYKLKTRPKVSIIIPTRDKADLLERCVNSIFELTTYENFEVIVADNNSEEEAIKQLIRRYEASHDNFRCIKMDFEFNYARINNLAVKECSGEYVVLLNNDTEIITTKWLEIMLGYASQRHVGSVGPKLLYADNTVQHGGTVMGLGVASHILVGKEANALIWGGRLSVPFNYSSVTAACLMVAKKKWEEVGGMEERLEVAYNDVDFNLKLIEKGYYNVFVPMVEIYHYESKSRGRDDNPEKKARFDREQEFMYRTWASEIKNDRFYNPNFSRRKPFRLDRKKVTN